MIKNLQQVTRMIVYFGEYAKARQSGVSQWCKVCMYCSKRVTDPLDPSVSYLQKAVSAKVVYWVPDSNATDTILYAKENGKKFTNDEEKSTGYELDANHIPQEYKYAFTEEGMMLNWERIEFGKTLYKVDANGKYVRTKDGKRIPSTGVTVAYWSGGDAIISGLTISKEYCVKRALSEWKEQVTSAPTITKDEEQPAEEQPLVES